MADALNTVGVEVVTTADPAGIEQTEAGLDSVKASAATTAASASSSFDSFNSSLKNVGAQMTSVGKSLSTYVTLPIVAIGAESVKMAMNFQQSMELLHTNAGVAQDAIGGISTAILNMASQVGQGPEALATAMYHISSAGNGLWSTTQQLNILKVAAEGAAIGQADLDDTTYALTSALASNVKGASDASQMMSTLVAIVGAGDMHMQDLNAAIGTGFLGTAASFGVSIQSIGAALATLGDNGEQGAAAATRLRMMLSLMASPSQAAAKDLGALGLTTDQVNASTGQMNAVFAQTGLTTTKLADDLRQPNGIAVAVEDLQSRLTATGLSASQTDAILAKAFGGGRTDAALLQLLQNTDRLNAKFQDINSTTGQFANDWAAQQQQAKQQWDDSWAGIQADLIRLGVTIMPEVSHAMTDLGHAIGNVTTWFDSLSQGQKQFVIDAAGVAAAVGPILVIFGTLAKSLSEIFTLTKTVGSAFGMIGEAAGLGGIGADAAGGAEAAGGLAAALGPVALGIGAIGIAAAGTYLLVKHFDQANNSTAENIKTNLMPGVAQYDDMAKTLGITLQGTTSQMTLMNLAQLQNTTSYAMVNKASAAVQTSQQVYTASTVVAAQKQDDLAKANLGVQAALAKYGANSPQYNAAVAGQTTAYDNYANALNETASKALAVQINVGNLSNSEHLWSGNVQSLNDLQLYLNSVLTQGMGVIAKFGPTAAGQVGAIDTLQAHLSTVVSSWANLNLSIQQQSPALNNSLQGLGSTISRVQGQSSTLNATLSSSLSSLGQLQNAGVSVQGGNVKLQQHASGTDSADAGWSIVGEEGPEIMYVPGGAQIFTASESRQMMSGGGTTALTSDNSTTTHTTTIGQVVLSTAAAVSQFFTQLDQDTINVSKGLTATRGLS